MSSTLARIFTGDLAIVAGMLAQADDPRETIAGTDLLDADVLGALIARFARNYAEPERRAVASQWSKWHFSTLLTPFLAASLVANHRMPTALADLDVVLSPDGRTAALRLRHEGDAIGPSDAFDRFEPLLTDHLEPVISALAAASGIAPRVLWSNAGNIFEQVLQRLQAALGPDHPAIAETVELLDTRKWRDGRPNRLFEPVRYRKVGADLKRQRRVCCIRYLIPSLDYCKTCPLDRP